MDPQCRIELFGWLRAYQDPRVITRFQSRHTGALLAYLAFHRDRSHHRDLLMEVAWPEDVRCADRHKLRVALNSLRQ
jgi:DNA-binding SARP family transcriptional activator